MSEKEHTRDVLSLDEGDTVTLVLDDGSEVTATLEDKRQHHDDTGPNIIDQKDLDFRRQSDGAKLHMSVTDGLSGLPEADPFPSYVPLFNWDDWDEATDGAGGDITPFTLGYVKEVKQ